MAVRISTTGEDRTNGSSNSNNYNRGNNTFRTAPFDVKPLISASCSPQWYEGHRRLRVTRGITNLRAEIIAKVRRGATGRVGGKKKKNNRQRQQQEELQASPAEGTTMNKKTAETTELGADEILLALATIDVDAVRDGYNYFQLFSPGNPEDDGSGSKRSGGEEAHSHSVAAYIDSARPGQFSQRSGVFCDCGRASFSSRLLSRL